MLMIPKCLQIVNMNVTWPDQAYNKSMICQFLTNSVHK